LKLECGTGKNERAKRWKSSLLGSQMKFGCSRERVEQYAHELSILLLGDLRDDFDFDDLFRATEQRAMQQADVEEHRGLDT
jgi:hypothetical protein